MEQTYWRRQTTEKPLFPDIEWAKPEQRSQRGRLGIVGGNKLGFAGVAESYTCATNSGAGEIKILLPDALKKSIPPMMTNITYGASNPSGSLSRETLPELVALGGWASGILLIGDAGRNSETAILYEDFIRRYDGPLTISRDAIDLLRNNSALLVERPNTLLVLSFAQLQKLFQSVYYPKVLTFSMQLTNLVEAVHKFTITYPVTLMVFHNETMVIAHGGEIVSMPWSDPMRIWRGCVAANAATYWLWNPTKVLESAATSLGK